jgi:transcriptional regulator with XRE-family HTH domain
MGANRMQTSPIREARQRAGLTQLKLCAKADVSIKTLAMAERWGARAVSRDSLRKIAVVLDVPPEQLTGEDVAKQLLATLEEACLRAKPEDAR